MNKWEYKYLLHVCSSQGNMPSFEQFNIIGAEGWELVQIVIVPQWVNSYAIFKRLKSE